MSDYLSPPPRGELFSEASAKVVWAGFLALPEHLKYELHARVREHLAVGDDRETPEQVHIARAVGAVREVAEMVARRDHTPVSEAKVSEPTFASLRSLHPECGWPPASTVRRWLATDWAGVLVRAGLSEASEGDVFVAQLGGAITRPELIAHVQVCARELGYAPTMRDCIRWAKTPDVRARPGRRARSQGPFDRLYSNHGGYAALLVDAGLGPAVSSSARRKAARSSSPR